MSTDSGMNSWNRDGDYILPQVSQLIHDIRTIQMKFHALNIPFKLIRMEFHEFYLNQKENMRYKIFKTFLTFLSFS